MPNSPSPDQGCYRLLWPPVYNGYPLCPDPECGHPFDQHISVPIGGCQTPRCRCQVRQGDVFVAIQAWAEATA